MTDALALRPEAAACLARMKATATAVTQIVEVHELDTDEDRERAAGLLRAIKTLTAEGEKHRKELKAPHLAAGRAVDEQFRPARAALERVEGLIKRRLAEAAQKREAARQKALAAAREAAAAHDHEAVNAALEQVDIAGLDNAPAGITTRWTYEVEAVAIREVPIEFLILDMSKVRAEIKTANAEGRPPSIPGVLFKKAASIAARRY